MVRQATLEDIFGPAVYVYTRRQAIADGVLVDVTDAAREAGFRIPVAVTQAVHAEYVDCDEDLRAQGQDPDGRLWDILWMCRMAIAASRTNGRELLFPVLVMMEAGKEAETVTLKAHCGPGDDGEPVLTIMKPNED
ncbi:MAG: DUF6573 family protein [Planctomycetota bacterium]